MWLQKVNIWKIIVKFFFFLYIYHTTQIYLPLNENEAHSTAKKK